MKARWSPYEQSRSNSRRKCECQVSTELQKRGHILGMKYPICLLFISATGVNKVPSSRVTHGLLWNSCQNSYSTCKTCSAPPYDNSCYRVCKYPKHWQLRSASFCSDLLGWTQIASCLCSVKSEQREAWLPETATVPAPPGKSTFLHSWAAGPLLPFSAMPMWSSLTSQDFKL